MKKEPVDIALDDPIAAHGSTLSVLTMRPPKGKDLRLAGYPFRIAGSGDKSEMVPDAAATSKLISMLCDIPSSSVDALEAVDWQQCFTTLANFLARSTPKNLSIDTTNKLDGGAQPN